MDNADGPPADRVLPLSALMNANDLPPLERYVENGREYSVFRKGQYLFPVDEQEKDRMDIFHKFFQVARRDILHSAPFKTYEIPRILDLGTGTGIWAIEMANKYRADVHGWDLAKIQPTTHLKPGYGWMEHVEIDMHPRCDDGTLHPESPLVDWMNYLFDSTAEAYHPLAYNPDTRHMLEILGFVEIQETVIKIPINPWPTDPHMKDIGRWYNLALTQGLEALSLAPLMRILRWNKADVDRITADAKQEICSRQNHVYYPAIQNLLVVDHKDVQLRSSDFT
ncbi:hypothetical protein B7494_g8630 [Chlorociboria aeruginascens]|nr:hypothetical protein B7494_g8630 [Chlorociboria aeruginascens]